MKFYFNAPYSPALNPIELVFSYVKFKMRKNGTITKEELTNEAFKAFSNVNKNFMIKRLIRILHFHELALQAKEI